MNTKLIKAVFAIATICLLASSASAQNQIQAVQQAQPVVQQPYVQPPQADQFYFGVQVKLLRSSCGGARLRIVSVTPGSPAFRAGLEYGDEILTLNGRSFANAYDSFDAARLMSRFVNLGSGPLVGNGGGAPAVAAAYVGLPTPPQPFAHMIVRNVRNGQNVSINVYPTPRNLYGGPAPAAATARQ